MPVEKSEESITLRFVTSGGNNHELVIPYDKFLKLGVGEAHIVSRMEVPYAPLGIRSELVNGRPHRVLTLTEVTVVDLGASDFDE